MRRSNHRHSLCLAVATAGLVAILVLLASSADAARTDVLIVDNGDRLTGEVKELKRGKLRYKTDHADTFDVEWIHVTQLTSVHQFEVEMESGHVYFGALRKPSEEGALAVGSVDEPIELDIVRVVRITPIAQRFWNRIDGGISFGFSFTSATQVKQLTLQGNAVYRSRGYLVDVNGRSIVTDQQELDVNRTNDLNLRYERFHGSRFFMEVYGTLQRNDEQGIALRTLVGGGPGRHLWQTNSKEMSASTGVVLNAETATGGEQRETGEITVRASFAYYLYDSPQTDISVTNSAFHNWEGEARFRNEFDSKATREIISDFTLDLSYFDKFDQRPPPGATGRRDWGIVFSLGWSY